MSALERCLKYLSRIRPACRGTNWLEDVARGAADEEGVVEAALDAEL